MVTQACALSYERLRQEIHKFKASLESLVKALLKKKKKKIWGKKIWYITCCQSTTTGCNLQYCQKKKWCYESVLYWKSEDIS